MSDLISRDAAIKEAYKIVIDGDTYEVVQVETLMGLPSAQTDLENKIRAIGYTGKEGRINIHGRLYAVRELAQ